MEKQYVRKERESGFLVPNQPELILSHSIILYRVKIGSDGIGPVERSNVLRVFPDIESRGIRVSKIEYQDFVLKNRSVQHEKSLQKPMKSLKDDVRSIRV